MTKLTIRDQRTEKRFFVDNVFVDEYGPIVGPYGHAVYNVLIRHSRPDGRGSWPSHATIAKKAGCGPAKVKQVLKQFEDLGLVAVRARYRDNGAQTSNEYIILDPPPLTEAPPLGDTREGYPIDTRPPVSQEATNNPPVEQSTVTNPPSLPPSAKRQPEPEPDPSPLPGTVEPWKGEPPPAARVYQSRLNRWPRRTQYRRIHETVGDAPEDLEFWGEVVAKYDALGWNNMNVDGMLEWYGRRKLPEVVRGNGGSGRETRHDRNRRILDEARRKFAVREADVVEGQCVVI